VRHFDLNEVGRNVGLDYELLVVKLNIENRLLMIWGEAVVVLRPDVDRDVLLDEPETPQLVEWILMNSQKLFQDAVSKVKLWS
jgi:Prion-inhibition and propagation